MRTIAAWCGVLLLCIACACARDLEWVRDVQSELYNASLAACNNTGPGCIEGYMYPEQLELMYGLVQAPHLHTFCETGFNAGHSFALYCSQADKRPVSIVSFDLFNKNYSLAVLDVLKEPCGKKLRTAVVAPGDSRVTIERFAATNPAFQCDFVYVDGGHDGDVPYLDLANLNRMSRRGATVVIDDIESPVIADAISRAKHAGFLVIHECYRHRVLQPEASPHPLVRGICVGTYV